MVEEEDNSTDISFEKKKGITHLFSFSILTLKGKKVRINGEWKGVSAGGCMDHLTWRYNPQIFFWPSRSSNVTISLTQITSGSPVGVGNEIKNQKFKKIKLLTK